MKRIRFWFLILFGMLSGLILVLDQVSKMWADLHFQKIPWTPLNTAPWFSFTYSENPGIAFGIPLSGPFLLMLSVGLIFAFVVYAVTHLDLNRLSVNIALSLILGGALGNTLDRFHYGFVRDFIDIGSWPTFNVADMGLSIGLILLALILYRSPHHGFSSRT